MIQVMLVAVGWVNAPQWDVLVSMIDAIIEKRPDLVIEQAHLLIIYTYGW